MSPFLARRDILRCRASLVAFGEKRTSNGRQDRLARSRMTRCRPRMCSATGCQLTIVVKSFIFRFSQSGSDRMQLDQLKRRDFITLLGGTAAAWPFGARAQQFAGVKRLGVLMSVRENDPEGKAQLSGFMEALAALGWISDRNLRMDIRWGGGDVSRTRTFAKELVALQPDVILTQGTPGTAALQPETRTIPIVFVVVADPVGPGFVSSISRPGGNITGFINSEASLGAKMLELLTEIAPTLKRVAMIFNFRHGAWPWDLLLPRFRGCCPLVQTGTDRSGRSQRRRNRNRRNITSRRAPRRHRRHTKLFYAQS